MIQAVPPLVLGDLTIPVPIIQGGMGVRVSTASLASAVANCGGAGTIASVGLGSSKQDERNYPEVSRKALQEEIRTAKKATDGPIGVNILGALTNYEDLVRTSAEENCDFIITGAGLPLKLPGSVPNTRTKLIPIVSSARTADLIIRTWKKRFDRLPDAFVIEGPKAGGHLGFSSENLKTGKSASLEQIFSETLAIVKKYEEEYKKEIPLIVAGGIYDGKDIAHFLKAGAKGVQMATRFVVTHECSVDDAFKQLYIAAKEEDIMIIDSPVGLPGRVIKTHFTERISANEKIPFFCNFQCLKTCNPKTAPYCIAQALLDAVNGDVSEAVVFAGSNVSRVDKIVSVKELMDELVSETLKELNK